MPSLRAGLSRLAPAAMLALGCASGEHRWADHPVSVTPPAEGCAEAGNGRARVPGLLEAGKLHRALRVMQRVEGACPEETEATWAPHVAALAAIGRTAEARQLADRIERSDRATQVDRAAAARARAAADVYDARPEDAEAAQARAGELFHQGTRAVKASRDADALALFQSSWTAWHPNARALVEAGLAARRLGRRAEAQRLWDRAAFDDPSEPIVPELPGSVRPLFESPSLAFSPSGRLLALASAEVVAVLDAALVVQVRVGSLGPSVTIASVAFGPEDGTVFAGLSDGRVRAWDLSTGELALELRGHTREVWALALSPDGRTLATASADETIRLWDPRTGALLRVLPLGADLSGSPGAGLQREAATRLAWSGDGGLLAWATTGAKVGLWDTRSGRLAATGEPRAGAVLALAFAERGLAVQTARRLLTYDLRRLGDERPKPLAETRSAGGARGVAAGPAGRPVQLAAASSAPDAGLVVADASGVRLQALDAAAPEAGFPIAPAESQVFALALSPGGGAERWAAAVRSGPTLRLYPVLGPGASRSLRPPEPFDGLTVGDDAPATGISAVTITATQRGVVRVFRSGVASPPPDAATLSAGSHARLAPDALRARIEGDTIAVGGRGDLTAQRYREPHARPTALARAPGDAIAAAFTDGAVRLFRGSTERAVLTLRPFPDSGPGSPAVAAGYVSAPSGQVDFLGPDAEIARAQARCRLGAVLYPFDVCAETFLVEDLLGKVLAGQDPAEVEP